MPTKALMIALLLSCSSLTVMALNQMAEPLRDLSMRAFIPLTITTVNWKSEVITTLQLCTVEDIPPGQAALFWGETSGGDQETVEEAADDAEPKCSTFELSSSFVLPANPTFYQLVIQDELGLAGIGSITFAMTAQTSLLSCGDWKVTKLSWTAEYPIVYNDPCIDEGTSFELDCYLAENFSNKDLCFDVNDDTVTVCLNGPIQEIPPTGQLAVNYLLYEDVSTQLPVSLSLSSLDTDMTSLRAIVWLGGNTALATVYDCPSGLCSMKEESIPGVDTYEVCGEARNPVDFSSLQTVTTKFTDLNLFAFLANVRAVVLEIVFANGRETKFYTASLLGAAPPDGLITPADTISIDCSGVDVGHACFGFFNTELTGPLYIAVSEKGATADMIIVPTTI